MAGVCVVSRRAEAESEASGPRLDAKREYEGYLARKVGAVLDQAFHFVALFLVALLAGK